MVKISLNGDYIMKYLGEKPYVSKIEPNLDEDAFLIKDAVPSYWEDMMDKFKVNSIHTVLKYNPSYTLQSYPQAGYVPDMCLPNILGSFAYKKTIKINKSLLKGSLRLRFGGVQNTISVWLNGKYLGKHKGYSSEFYFDVEYNEITDGENTFVFVVSNNYLKGYKNRIISGCTTRAANQATGGIFGDVDIICFSDGFLDAFVSTAKDLKSITVHVFGAQRSLKRISIKDGNNELYNAIIKPNCNSVTLSTESLELWSIKSPNIYMLTVFTESEQLSMPFGIRRLTVSGDGKHLLLNGKSFYFRAICEHGYFPLTVHPVHDKAYYSNVITKIKELGFNAIRFHTWVPTEEYMQAADELGVLIEVETPNNTTIKEWREIVNATRKHPSVVMYSSGNELLIDESYITHLKKCAKLVHSQTDSLFSPMSAMRGVEYGCEERGLVEKPFRYNPKRLEKLSKFCDGYNSYSRGLTSYFSDKGDPDVMNERNVVYKKPLLSHEICILGTYCDISLAKRYNGSRIGQTKLYSSVIEHLTEKGLIDKAQLFYKNSCEWQKLLRKQCFETVRKTSSLSGYDFLGDIDHHWHTFGYSVGLMNEFYELKPGVTVENVLQYNSDVVLLAKLPADVNITMGTKVNIPILVSNYLCDIKNAILELKVCADEKIYDYQTITIDNITSGTLKEAYNLSFILQEEKQPVNVKVYATLRFEGQVFSNVWDLYSFPRIVHNNTMEKFNDVVFVDEVTETQLCEMLENGKSVVMLSKTPFTSIRTSFRISCAGRTEGHLATVIDKNHFIFKDFPNDGYCGWQFKNMINGGCSTALDLPNSEYEPIIEIASSYKYARREALIFEYKVAKGKLFVCTLNLPETDCGASFLRSKIIEYVNSVAFNPKVSLSIDEVHKLCNQEPVFVIENANEACNVNDVTM